MHGWVMGRTSKQATKQILVAGQEKSLGSEDPSDALIEEGKREVPKDERVTR